MLAANTHSRQALVGSVQAVSDIEKTGEGDPQRRLGRSLEAVGEALFYFADQKKKKSDP
jgi:hypothetical protein